MKKNFLIFTLCIVTNSVVVPNAINEDSINANINYHKISERIETTIDISKKKEETNKIIETEADYYAGISKNIYNIQQKETQKRKEPKIEPKTMYTTTNINFRTLPTIESDVIEVLTINVPVLVTGKQGEWYAVSLGDKTGFVYANYLSEEMVPIIEQNKWNISLTNDEINLLANIVWLEARGETSIGQEAVVEVVLNRMLSSEYPNNIYDILSQRGQFSTWGSVYSASPTSKEFTAIQNVLDGNTNHTTIQTLYFSTRPRNSRISAQIGNHFFCER